VSPSAAGAGSGPSLAVAVLQCRGADGDPQANLALLDEACARAARQGARLLVTPELFLSGFYIGNEVARLATPRDGAPIRDLAGMARRHGVGLCVGYPERAGEAVHNAAVLVHPDGRVLGHYRKQRLSGPFERAAFRPGDGRDLLAELDGVRLGVLICYDLEFPENARRLALAGVDLVLSPTALALEFALVADKLVPTRAFENTMFVAYADRCGHERGYAYAGRSCIVAPDGHDLARAGEGEALIGARVEPARFAALRERLPYLRDLRQG